MSTEIYQMLHDTTYGELLMSRFIYYCSNTQHRLNQNVSDILENARSYSRDKLVIQRQIMKPQSKCQML